MSYTRRCDASVRGVRDRAERYGSQAAPLRAKGKLALSGVLLSPPRVEA